jgi:hypothetical protein
MTPSSRQLCQHIDKSLDWPSGSLARSVLLGCEAPRLRLRALRPLWILGPAATSNSTINSKQIWIFDSSIDCKRCFDHGREYV